MIASVKAKLSGGKDKEFSNLADLAGDVSPKDIIEKVDIYYSKLYCDGNEEKKIRRVSSIKLNPMSHAPTMKNDDKIEYTNSYDDIINSEFDKSNPLFKSEDNNSNYYNDNKPKEMYEEKQDDNKGKNITMKIKKKKSPSLTLMTPSPVSVDYGNSDSKFAIDPSPEQQQQLNTVFSKAEKSTNKSKIINDENKHPNKIFNELQQEKNDLFETSFINENFSPLKTTTNNNKESGLTSGIKKTPKVKHIKLNDFDYSSDTIELLFSKVRHNRIEYVEQQLSDGFNPNIIDSNGNTMIHICAQNNLKKLASIIYDYGADLNITNYKNLTALYYSKKYEFSKMTNWLVMNGAV